MMHVVFYIFIYGLLFLSFEILQKNTFLSTGATRRIIHISSALIALSLPKYLTLGQILFICIFFLVFLIISKRMALLESIHKVDRKTWGEIYFPLGIAIMALSFLPAHVKSYEIAVIIYGASDVLANLIGTLYGTHAFSIFKCKKTIEGSIAFFISTLAILVIFNVSLPMAAFISLVTTLVEGISPYGSDNLTIPIVVSILLTFIRI